MKKIVYIDMDNVLVDYQSGIDRLSDSYREKYKGKYYNCPGIFALMEPLVGAIDAVNKLSPVYELYVLTTTPWLNTTAPSDKLLWIHKYFGKDRHSIFYKRLIITHYKNLNCGDYLIDDSTRNGAGEFAGELIQFGSERFPGWDAVVEYLLGKAL